MNNSKLFSLCICLTIASNANSQVKKTIPQTKAPVKTVLTEDKGPLDPQDYKYYFLVRRGSTGTANGTYTLKHRPSPASNLSTPLVMMDVRTVKEISWWPELETSVKQNNIYGYTIDRQGPLLIKYSPTGKFIFSKYLNWQTPTGEQGQLFKSSDDKQVFTVYNNDVWVGNFDLSSGSSANVHQVTQSGLMNLRNDGYLRNNILLLDNYMVNTQDGKYQKSFPSPTIISDSSRYYNIYDPTQILPQYSWLYSFSGWNQIYFLSRPGEQALHWLNREQTKMLWQRTPPKNGETKFYIRIYDPSKYPSPKNVDNVTWTQIIATLPNRLWGPLLELAISPNSKYLITPGFLPGTNKSVVYVYNLETLVEYFLPINIGQYPPEETAWADDTHLIITMRADRMSSDMINEQTRITTENQGTYILDVETKQLKKLTPYLIKDYDKNFVRLLGAKTILFEANNYIFRSNSDGTELTQLTKIPGVYKLVGAFIK